MPYVFKNPCGMTPDEIWDDIQAVRLTDPMVHRVMDVQRYMGLDREHTALILAHALLQALHETQQSFSDWIKATPRPVTVPLDPIARDLMFNPPAKG